MRIYKSNFQNRRTNTSQHRLLFVPVRVYYTSQIGISIKMIISTTFSFPVFCLLFVGLPIATVGWSPLQTSRTSFRFDYTQHPYQSSTRKFHQCHKNRKFSSRSKLFVAADNSEETAMGLNELQTLFREAGE